MHPSIRRSPPPRLALLIALGLLAARPAFAQQPVVVRIDAVDPEHGALTIMHRDTIRMMPMATAMRVTVDDREATPADIRPGDTATVVYDKTVHGLTRVDVWRKMPPDIRWELLEDGGFEQLSDAANLLRWERQSGHVMSSDDARHGARSLSLEVSAGDSEARIFSTPRRRLRPGAVYRLSVWAKGRGTLAIGVYQYGSVNPLPTEFLRDAPPLSLTDEWQQLRVDYRPSDKRLQAVAFALVLYGGDGRAVIDDASFRFSESDNPGFTLDAPPPSRDLRIAVDTRDAAVEIAVAGRPVAIADGVATARVAEGLAVIAVRATANGYRPGVRLRVLDQPETDGRWRATDREAQGWHTAEFDDRAWPQAVIGRDGFAWPAVERARSACFRQVLLWNEAHHGPDRCILPRTRTWGFSQDGIDNLLLALYSPLPFDLDGYELVLDVPQPFELFGIDEPYYQRYVTNEKPAALTREALRREGQAFTRYRIAFAPKQVPAEATHYVWLPLRLRGGRPGESTRFFFHRRGHGNFTECEQSLPVTILPRINGRQPRRVLLSQYAPIFTSTLAPRHMRATIAQSAAVGFNLAALTITEPGWGPDWIVYQRSFLAELTANGIGTMIGSPGHFPLYGSHVAGHQSDAFLRWVAATPDAQAAYFDGRAWNAERDSMYCPSFMIEEGGKRFREIVTSTYAEILARTPAASVLFLDYEAHAWLEGSRPGLGGSFCFCDRCKARFRKRAGLPRDTDLSNQSIHDSHHRAWSEFHTSQAAELQRQMKAVANSLGLRYMIYSYAGVAPFWSNIGGKIDIAFPGSPGNNVASGSIQKSLDEEGRFLRTTQAVPTVIGQRFSFLGMSEAKGAWREINALSDDGFVDAKSWKSQILRVVAAFGGGVDLQNSQECVAGMPYWIGEATRIIAAHEDLFLEGERADKLAVSNQIAYPDLLVLRKGRRRLVLLFNENDADRKVTLRNLELEPGQRAHVFEKEDRHPAESLDLVVPAGDAVAVIIE
jgi:hypothetical protein